MSDPQQGTLPFYETAEDATKSAILKSDKKMKEVAHALRPDTSIGTAYSWLTNALKDDAREKLSGDQHFFIANFTGQYDYLYYGAQKCHHTRPEPVAPEDELATLDRQILQGIQEQNVNLNRYLALKNGKGN